MNHLAHFNSIQETKDFLNEKMLKQGNKSISQYLLRGQTKSHGNLTSTFARIINDNILIGQCHTTYQYFAHVGIKGLFGYHIEAQETLAVLQHYGFVTPQIDLTASVPHALFFATDGLKIGDVPVVYIIDIDKINHEEITITDHTFLVQPMNEGGLKCRWLSQDGYAIMPKEWNRADLSRKFNLYDSSYSEFISFVTFTPSDLKNISFTKEQVYNIEGDFILEKLRSVISIYCRGFHKEELDDRLKEIIERMR
jgi:hypothetical protein